MPRDSSSPAARPVFLRRRRARLAEWAGVALWLAVTAGFLGSVMAPLGAAGAASAADGYAAGRPGKTSSSAPRKASS